jgi:hypothetical protein
MSSGDMSVMQYSANLSMEEVSMVGTPSTLRTMRTSCLVVRRHSAVRKLLR